MLSELRLLPAEEGFLTVDTEDIVTLARGVFQGDVRLVIELVEPLGPHP